MRQAEKNAIDAIGHFITNVSSELEVPVDFHVDSNHVSITLFTNNATEEERGRGRHTFEVPMELWKKYSNSPSGSSNILGIG
jgi:hypothetical protein